MAFSVQDKIKEQALDGVKDVDIKTYIRVDASKSCESCSWRSAVKRSCKRAERSITSRDRTCMRVKAVEELQEASSRLCAVY